MTTIATDGRTMAADTMSCSNFIDQRPSEKMLFVPACAINPRPVLYGGSGCAESVERYFAWVKGEIDEKPKFKSDDFTIISIDDREVYVMYDQLHRIRVGVPYAIGSGSEFAMGAMLAGKSPEEAVAIAIRLDKDSGGEVRTMIVL